MRSVILLLLAFLVWSCKDDQVNGVRSVKVVTAQEIVDNSIAVSGGGKFNNSSIGFNFRSNFYTASRKNGDFSLSRIKLEEGDSIIDILSNDGFARFINNEFQMIPDSLGQKYSASVNSVHYFSILPYGLNDSAVNKKMIGQEPIKGKVYYKVQITFSSDGGGEDFEDVFIYWIEKNTFKVDYLAYSYNEDDGVGLRFRSAYNERYVSGLRFVDYKNYKPSNNDAQLTNLGELFNNDQLDLVSTIELQNLQVKLLDLN